MTADVRLIAAVGKRGQLGLNGRIPWKDADDLYQFRRATEGGVLIMGHNTAGVLGWGGHISSDRFVSIPSPHLSDWSAPLMVAHLSREFPGRTIWVCGGAKTYRLFLPFVRTCVITLIDYDGEADCFMPPLWGVPDH